MEEAGRRIPSPSPTTRQVSFATSKGTIFIRTCCDDRFISELSTASGIGLFFHYRASAPEEQHEVLLKVARLPSSDVVLAFTEQRAIVGYVAMHPVSDAKRWGEGNSAGYYEFGAIEVSRSWRGAGLSRLLMETAFGDRWFDDKIVLSSELCWHWDLAATGLSKREYRRLLFKVLSRAGFKEYPTDEGNIQMDPNNLFTARIGSRVSDSLRDTFFRSLFTNETVDSYWSPAAW